MGKERDKERDKDKTKKEEEVSSRERDPVLITLGKRRILPWRRNSWYPWEHLLWLENIHNINSSLVPGRYELFSESGPPPSQIPRILDNMC